MTVQLAAALPLAAPWRSVTRSAVVIRPVAGSSWLFCQLDRASRSVSSGTSGSNRSDDTVWPAHSSRLFSSVPVTASGAAISPTPGALAGRAAKLAAPWAVGLSSSSVKAKPPAPPAPVVKSPVSASLAFGTSTLTTQALETQAPETSPDAAGSGGRAAYQPLMSCLKAPSPLVSNRSRTKALAAGSAALGAWPISRTDRPGSSARAAVAISQSPIVAVPKKPARIRPSHITPVSGHGGGRESRLRRSWPAWRRRRGASARRTLRSAPCAPAGRRPARLRRRAPSGPADRALRSRRPSAGWRG